MQQAQARGLTLPQLLAELTEQLVQPTSLAHLQ